MNFARALADKYMLKLVNAARVEESVVLVGPTKITCADGVRYTLLLSRDGSIPAGMRLVRRGNTLMIEVDGQVILVLENFYTVDGAFFIVDAAGDTITAQTDKLRSLSQIDDLIWGEDSVAVLPWGAAGGFGVALAGLAIATSAAGNRPASKDALAVDSVTDGYVSDGKSLFVTLPTDAKAGQTIRVKLFLDSGLIDTITHTLTDDDIAKGTVQMHIPADAITQQPGTYSAIVDLLLGVTVLNSANIDIVYINDGDNGMALALDGDVNPYDGLDCLVTLPSSARAGDTIRTLIYVEGVFAPVGTVDTVLTADDILAGVLHQHMTDLDVSRDAKYNGQSLCLAPNGSQRESAEKDGIFTIYDGVVQDDYLAGAQVFIDRNRNSQWDAGEEIATTDQNGHFFFMTAPDGAPILAVGGVDAASGAPNATIVYRAFSTGSNARTGIDIVLSPLSTLIASIADAKKGGSGDPLTEAELLAAAEIARDALGLDPNASGADLLRVDPIAASLSGAPTAGEIAVIAANRQLAVVLASVGALINGASEESNAGSDYAAQSLAALLIAQNDLGATVSLSSSEQVRAVFVTAMENSNNDGNTTDLRTTDPEDLDRIAVIVSAFNNRIAAGTNADSGPMNDDARAAMRTAYDLIVPLLERAGAEAGSDRGGDLSLTDDAQELETDLAAPGGLAGLVDDAIATVKTNLSTGFETNAAFGIAGQFLPLDIQIPALPFGSTVDGVTLRDVPDSVAVYLVNPITLAMTLLVPDHVGHYTLSAASQLGYLYVKSETATDFDMTLQITGTNAGGQTFEFDGLCPIEFVVLGVITKASVTAVYSDLGDDLVAVPQGSSTEDSSPRLEGVLNQALSDGQRVALYVDEMYLGNATVTGTEWVFLGGRALANGRVDIVARVIDGSDKIVSACYPYRVVIDAPVATAILSNVTDDYNQDPATTLSADATPTLRGTTSLPLALGQKVAVYDGETLLGYAEIDGDAWSFTPKTPLEPGQHILTIVIQDQDKSLVSTSEPLTLTIDPPSAPTEFDAPSLDPNGAAVGNPANGVTVINPPTILIGPLARGMTDVVVLVDGAPIAGEYDPATGLFTPAEPLSLGGHALSYQFVDQYGAAVGGSVPMTLTVIEPAYVFSIQPTTLLPYTAPVQGEMTEITFTILRTDASGPAHVDWTASGLSDAMLAAINASGRVQFAAGETSLPISILVPVNAVHQILQTLTIQLDGASGGFWVDADNNAASAQILDDSLAIDPASSTFAISSSEGLTLTEGAAGTSKTITYTVTRFGNTESEAEIPWALQPSGQSLVGRDDFAGNGTQDRLDTNNGLPSGVIIFAQGETIKTFYVQIQGDNNLGPNESFSVALTVPKGDKVVGDRTTTLVNDDANISVSLTQGPLPDEVLHSFVITRSGATTGTHSVAYSLLPSGEMGQDNLSAVLTSALTGNVTFAPGQTEHTITVTHAVAALIGVYQTFALHLSAAEGSNVSIVNAAAQSSLVPNLQDISISSDLDRVLEGTAPETAGEFVYRVTRSGRTDLAADIDWAISGHGDSPAVASDFPLGVFPSGTVHFAAGETSAEIRFRPAPDTHLEGEESFVLQLTADTATIRLIDNALDGVIVDDESAVGFDQDIPFSVVEGDSGTADLIATVVRIGFAGAESTVEWRVTPGTAGLADFATGQDVLGDNNGYPSGRLTLLPGEITSTARIRIRADWVLEADEIFEISLSNPSSNTQVIGQTVQFAGYSDSAVATIVNDDSVLSIQRDTYSVTEGNGGTSAMMAITVLREGSTVGSDWVNWSLSSKGNAPADGADIGDAAAGLTLFNSPKNSWITLSQISGLQAESGSFDLPKSGYILLAYNRGQDYTDAQGVNLPFDRFLLNALTVEGNASLTVLGDVTQQNFVADNVRLGQFSGTLFTSQSGYGLPNLTTGGNTVVITSDQQMGGISLRVTGLDINGETIRETIYGPNQGAVATSLQFASVLSVEAVQTHFDLGKLHQARSLQSPDFNDLNDGDGIELTMNRTISTLGTQYFQHGNDIANADMSDSSEPYNLTIRTGADLTGSQVVIYGGMTVAMFDNGYGGLNSYQSRRTTTDDSGDKVRFDAAQHIRAENLGGRYQDEDDSSAPSHFVVTGHDAQGDYIVETIIVPQAEPDLFATLSAFAAGTISIATPFEAAAGRVTFLVRSTTDDAINDGANLNFTVTGLDANGAIITEVVQVDLHNLQRINATVQDFASVTSIISDGGFDGTFSIGQSRPVFTENSFVSIEAVAPVDQDGHAIESIAAGMDFGRFEFTADLKIVVEGGPAGLLVVPGLINYVRGIALRNDSLADASFDIGVDVPRESSHVLTLADFVTWGAGEFSAKDIAAIGIDHIGGRIEVNQGSKADQHWVLLDGDQLDLDLLQAGAYRLVDAKGPSVDFDTLANRLDNLQNGFALNYSDLNSDSWGDAGGDLYDGGNMLSIDGQPQTLWNSDAAPEFIPASFGQYRYMTGTSGTALVIQDFSASEFSINGYLGADGSGQEDLGVLQGMPSGVTVIFDRVSGSGDPSLHKLFITNASDPQFTASTDDTNDETVTLTNLGDATFMCYITLATAPEVSLRDDELRDFVTAFLLGAPLAATVETKGGDQFAVQGGSDWIDHFESAQMLSTGDTITMSSQLQGTDAGTAYAIVRIDAPMASADHPVSVQFDMQVLGRVGLDSASISYAPDGQWSKNGAKATESVTLVLPALTTEQAWSTPNLDNLRIEIPNGADGVHIENVTAGRLEVKWDGEWIDILTFADLMETDVISFESLAQAISQGDLRMSAGGVTLHAAFSEDGEWNDAQPIQIGDPDAAAPLPATAIGTTQFNDSGYLWLRYTNAAKGLEGADSATVNSLYVTGGGSLNLVGQKVITQGVAQTQILDGAMELALNGSATHSQTLHLGDYAGDLIVYVSRDPSVSHLQNGNYEVTGRDANGVTVTIQGGWTTTDIYAGWPYGQSEGSALVLSGLRGLVSIDALRIDEYTMADGEVTGWDDGTPYMLSMPILSVTSGSMNSLSTGFTFESIQSEDRSDLRNSQGWNSNYWDRLQANVENANIPGAPLTAGWWANEPLGTEKVGQNLAVGTDAATWEFNWSDSVAARMTFSSRSDLEGRSFVISGFNAAEELITETVTFGAGTHFASSENKFISVIGVQGLAGDKTGLVNLNAEGAFTDGISRALVCFNWELDQPSFAVAGLDADGNYVEKTVRDIGVNDPVVLGMFTSILAVQPLSTIDSLNFGYFRVDSLDDLYVDIPLAGQRDSENMLNLGGEQRITIGTGAGSHQNIYRVIGLDGDGNRIEEVISNIAHGSRDNDDLAMLDGSDPDEDEKNGGVYAITTQYFAKLLSVSMHRFHQNDAETMTVGSVGTVGAPLLADTPIDRYGAQFDLGASIAEFETASKLSFKSDDNLSDRDFSVTGRLADGRVVTEIVTGPNNGIVLTTNSFVSVSQIAASDGAIGAIKVGYQTSAGGLIDNFIVTGAGTAADPFVAHSINTVENGTNGVMTAGESVSEADILFYLDMADAAGAVTLHYDLAVQGSAGADSLTLEYASNVLTLLSGRANFADGDVETTILIPIMGDDHRERDEQMTLTLGSSSVGTTVDTNANRAALTILNNDDEVTLTTSAVSGAEGNGAGGTFTFTATRLNSTHAKDVLWSIEGLDGEGTASADDFDAISGVFTFAQGALTATVTVQLMGDHKFEADESFDFVLSAPSLGSGYSVSGAGATTGVIVNDDARVSIRVTNSSLAEGDTGTVQHVFTILREGDLSQASRLDYSVTGLEYTNSVPAIGADFGGALPAGEITFAAGPSGSQNSQEQTITVVSKGNTDFSGDVAYRVTLSNHLDDVTDIGTAHADDLIREDDPISVIGVDLAKVEGTDNAAPTALEYTISRAGDTTRAVTLHWAAVLPQGSSASPDDFPDGLPSGTVTFAAGQSTATVTILVTADTNVERDETFTLRFSSDSADVAPLDRIATILGDDIGFGIDTNVQEFVEGNTVHPTILVTFIRAGNSVAEASYNWAITGVETHDSYGATDSNFVSALTGEITFAVGQSEKTISLEVDANSQYDVNRSFRVNMLDAQDNILSSSPLLTIQNDDSAIAIIAEKSTMNEGSDNDPNALYATIKYTILREGNLDQTSTVEWRMSGKEGVTLQDFGPISDGLGDNDGFPSGMATFGAGVSAIDVTVLVRRDSTYEADEDFEIMLSNPSVGAALELANRSAITILTNDDVGIHFSQTTLAAQTTTNEGDHDKGGAYSAFTGDDTQYTTISYTVERVGNTLVQSKVFWTLTYLDGTSDDDFVLPVSRELNFGASDTDPQTFDIKVRKDLLAEGNEAFKVTLSTDSLGSSTEVDHVITTTIVDNDEGLRLLGGQSARKYVSEGQSENAEISWTLERTGDLRAALDVDYVVSGASLYESLPDITNWLPHAAGDDFVGGQYPTGTVHFAQGAATATITVQIQGNLDIESSESFQIVLTPQRLIDQLSINEGNPYGTALSYLNTQDLQALEGVILRDEAIVAISEELVSNTVFDTLGLANAKLEGDTNAEYVSHFFKVYRTLTTAGTLTVDWNVEGSAGLNLSDSQIFAQDQVIGATSADFILKEGQIANDAGMPSGTVTIPEGQSFVLVEIRTIGNLIATDSKRFNVVLSNVSDGSTINTEYESHIGEGILKNDDPLFSVGLITPNDESPLTSGSRIWTETDGQISYRIYRTGDTDGAALVDYAITFPAVVSLSDDSPLKARYAASAADFDTAFAPLTGTVEFADGQEFATVTFKLINDTEVENFAETFNLSLNSARWKAGTDSPKTIGISAVAGSMDQVILEDEVGSRVAVTAVSSEAGGALTLYEGTDTAAKTVTYTLTRTGSDRSAGQIAWQISGHKLDGLAGDTGAQLVYAQNDGYRIYRGLVTFGQDEMVKTVTATLSQNNDVEGNAAINFEIFDTRQILKDNVSLYWGWGDDGNADQGIYLVDSATANNTGLLPASGSILRDETQHAITVNLLNDDTAVVVNSQIDNSPAIAVWETDSGVSGVTVNLGRRGNLEHDLTLAYDIILTGSADAQDVIVTSGTFTLTAATGPVSSGSKDYSFNLDILKGDLGLEENETFVIRLSNIETNAIEAAYFQHNWTKSATIDIPVTIKTNDVTWTAAAEVTELVELDSGFSTYSFTISRPEGGGNYSGPATVAWQVLGTGIYAATASDFYGYDNQMPAGSVTFVEGEFTKTITINVAGDNTVERNETFTIGIVSATVGQIDSATTTMKIRNNDSGIRISDASVLEGDTGSSELTFTVTRSGNLTQSAEAKWTATMEGTASLIDLADTISGGGDLAFDAIQTDYLVNGDAADYGEESQQVTVTIKGDTLGEDDETLFVRLSALQNINQSIDLLGTGTILNDDTRFSIQAGPGVVEGDALGQMFIIRRDRSTHQDQTVNWSVSTEGGSHGATSLDLVDAEQSSILLSNSVTFHEGELEKIVYIKTVGDTVAETDQSFIFAFDPGAGVTLDQVPAEKAYGLILNDDAGPVIVLPDSYLVVSDATAVAEGDSGTVFAEFTVTRSGALGFAGTVNWAVAVTSNESNNANAADFVGGLVTGSLDMAAGKTSFTIRVPISGDNAMEGNETFKLVLSDPSPGLAITTDTGIGTISNDDARFDIQSAVSNYANATAIDEGTGDAPTQISFTILRTGDTSRAMSVNWDVAHRDQDSYGTGDFGGNGFPSGVVNFAAGDVSQVVTIDIRADDLYEINETFRIKLTDSSAGSTRGAFNSFFKVMNDDQDVFAVQANTRLLSEGDAQGSATNFTFTATRQNGQTTATVDWTAEGSGDQPLDLSQLLASSGKISFAIGELSKDFTVSVANNLLGDYDRGFDVRLSNPLIYLPNSTLQTTDDLADTLFGGMIDADHGAVSVTLTNDDPVYFVNFTGDGSSIEGNGTHGGFVRFLITRTGDASGETSLNWALSSQGAVGANLSDFGGFWPSGRVVFQDGETEKLVQARIAGDLKYEGDETFKVTISNIVSAVPGAVILVNTDQGVILNDDNGVFVSTEISDVLEGDDDSTHSVALNLNVTGLPNQAVTVHYVIEGYGLNPINAQDLGEGSFGIGERTLYTDQNGSASDSITVWVLGDNAYGANESMRLRVTSIVNGSLAENTGLINIVNDDSLIRISRAETNPITVVEGDTDMLSLTYIVTRTGETTGGTYFTYEVAGAGDNPALADDFNGFGPSTGYFAPGQTEVEITVQINADTVFESDEGFVIRLLPYQGLVANPPSNIADIDISAAQITEIIKNDDSASIVIEPLIDSVKEGTFGANTLTYRITRNGDISQDLIVSYSLANDQDNGGGLTQEAVQGGLTGTVTILAGQEYVDLSLLTVPDALGGPNIAFTLSISAAGFQDPPSVTGKIVDDDAGISLTLAEAEIAESSVFTLHFTRAGTNLAATNVAWDLITRGRDSIEQGDFAEDTALNGIVSFAEGETEKTITLSLNDDSYVEGTEQFVLRLLSSSDVTQTLRTPEIQGTILNNDTISHGTDIILMGAGSTRIEALGGDDLVLGGGGADVIFGGDGNDTLAAGTQGIFIPQNQALHGSAQLYGGDGDDLLIIGASGLTGDAVPPGLFGGDGFDAVSLDLNQSNITYDLRQLAHPGQYDSIEAILLGPMLSGFNTLKLSAQSMGLQNVDILFDAEKGLGGGLRQLFILGQAGDRVQLVDFTDWTMAPVTIELVRPWENALGSYTVYTNQSAQTQLIVGSDIEVVLGQIQIAIDANGAWEDLNHNGLRDDGATDLALVNSSEHPGLFTIEGISFVDDAVELRFVGQFDTEIDMTGAGQGDTVLIDLLSNPDAWFNHPADAVIQFIDGNLPALHLTSDQGPSPQDLTMTVFRPEASDVIQIGLVSDPSDAADQIPYQGLHLASYVADTVEISYVHPQIT